MILTLGIIVFLFIGLCTIFIKKIIKNIKDGKE